MSNKKDITTILEYAADKDAQKAKLGEPPFAGQQVHRLGKLVFEAEKNDIMTPYCKFLRDLIVDGVGAGDRPLEGMKIVVDAGNGGGGFYATRVLKPLGADISASQFLEPDGMFENHAPNPEDKEAINAISGHAALKENFFLDDGAYLATKIVIKAAKLFRQGEKIDSVIEELEDPADEREIRIPIRDDDFAGYGDKVLAELEEYAKATEGFSLEEPNYEGVRINFDGEGCGAEGWCLLRKSLHDPLLPMNMASDEAGGCEKIKKIMMEFLSRYDKLEL